MSEHYDSYTLACPVCGDGFQIEPGNDLCYADDWADDCTTACPGCGVALKVQSRTEVFFTAEQADKMDKKGGA